MLFLGLQPLEVWSGTPAVEGIVPFRAPYPRCFLDYDLPIVENIITEAAMLSVRPDRQKSRFARLPKCPPINNARSTPFVHVRGDSGGEP
jgi:hypothetical protein